MTLIIAATDADGSSVIGADSRTASDYSYTDNCDKLVRIHDYVVGVAGSSRVAQLIRYQVDVFSPIEGEADVFMFSAGLKQVIADDYSVKTGHDIEERFTVLLATMAGVFCVFRNFQFYKYDVWAIGSGDDFGMGVYHGLGDFGDTETRIRKSIEATAGFVPSVGGPVVVRKVS